MVQIISGKKGKGKTKYLLDMANEAVDKTDGSIVYLDKSSKHMYELSARVRLINVFEYMIETKEEFIGFILGIISQDHDVQEMYLDSFLKLSRLEGEDITDTIDTLNQISEKFGVKFIISVSRDQAELTDAVKPYIIYSL